MKKLVLLTLVVAMVFSMAACSCNHKPGDLQIVSVDTEKLTIAWEQPCSKCGEVIETKETATGVASANGVFPLSPTEWFDCLSSNIYQYGANNTLAAFTAESEDNALVNGVISFNGMKAAFSFRDAEGNILTTDQQDQRGLVNSIHVEGLFDNATATEFFQLIMLTAINCNSEMDPNTANQLAAAVMAFETVSNNGYIYSLGILSAEDHTVLLTITAE